ncbi:hypothetical protein DFH08DRAFT_800099 [Mycena albidolilacea]|uniref:Uncharacterized protein n=1 Tax=Mycena albidolilacea TaxID=1033008 RepID=A0AAD7F1B3_9AGAR|nr:hypothetical protein DFH08DRAFT_800099 [Mycena albidolilacea]
MAMPNFYLSVSVSLVLASTLLSLTVGAAQFCLPMNTTAYPSLSAYPPSHSSSSLLHFWMPIATLHVTIILVTILAVVCDLYAKQCRQSRVSKSADKWLTGALLDYFRNRADFIDLRSSLFRPNAPAPLDAPATVKYGEWIHLKKKPNLGLPVSASTHKKDAFCAGWDYSICKFKFSASEGHLDEIHSIVVMHEDSI